MRVKLNKNQEKLASKACEIIKQGGIVILPFDTVYGVIADPRNESALRKIFEFKKRPQNKILGLVADSFETLERISETGSNKKFIQEKIPGKFTFILNAKNDHISDLCTRNGTIGLRIPDNELVVSIAKQCGGVLAQTSANLTGGKDCFSIEEIESQFSSDNLKKVDLIIDGGRIKSDGSSRIFYLTEEITEEIKRK